MIKSNLPQLILKYRKLHKDLSERVMESSAGIMGTLLEKGFRQQTDPYGKPWPKNNDGSKFDRNGDIKASFQSSYGKDKATLSSDLTFAKYHQEGTKTLPQRMMIPDESKGLGEWKTPILNAARTVVRDIMNGTYTPYMLKKANRAKAAKIKSAERAYERRIKAKESKQ